MPESKAEILERIATDAKLAVLPETFARLLKMFDDPEVTATEVAAVLVKDAGMVARLLRIANSAFYGGTGTVATAQQAIVKLGFRTAKAIVLSSTMYQSIRQHAPKELDLRPFWQHGLEVAVAAMLIAEELCPKSADEAFVAGLLHDVGRVAFASTFPEQFRSAVAGGAASWSRESEAATFGVDHAEAGAFLAERWNFPQVLRDAIAGHHEIPGALSAEPAERVALCVALADSRAQYSWAGPAALRKECHDRREACMRLSGLTEERLANIDKQVMPQMREWAEFLEIELDDPLDLLAAANHKLFELYRVAADLNAENEKLQTRLLAEQAEKAKLEALRVVCATFSHHINNATTTILGRAQLVHLAMTGREQDEHTEKVARSMKAIENAVDTISGILSELKCLSRFDTVAYHGKAEILDLQQTPGHAPSDPAPKPA